MCFYLNLVNTLGKGKVISPLYRNTLSPVATVVQWERKDTSILQLHPLSGSKSIARCHHSGLLFIKVQPVREGSVGYQGRAVRCCSGGRAQGWGGTSQEGKWTYLICGDSLVQGPGPPYQVSRENAVVRGTCYICPFPHSCQTL